MEAKTGIKSHKDGYIWELYSLLHIYKWICENMCCFHFYKALQAHITIRATLSSQTILLTSTNTFQTVIGFQTTSYMSLNASKSETHDKKKDPWMEFLLARKWIWCHADTKTRHAAQKYYAVVVATNQTTTMSATGRGCSPWAFMWFHGLCVF